MSVGKEIAGLAAEAEPGSPFSILLMVYTWHFHAAALGISHFHSSDPSQQSPMEGNTGDPPPRQQEP